MNIAVKWPYITELPKYCDECPYYETRPHPMRGWTDSCALCSQCLDCEEGDDGWHYDGNKRPDNCPLVDLDKDNEYEYCSKVEQLEDTEDVRDIDFKTYDGIVSALLQRIYECSESMIDSDGVVMTPCASCPLSAHLKASTCTYLPDICNRALELKDAIDRK